MTDYPFEPITIDDIQNEYVFEFVADAMRGFYLLEGSPADDYFELSVFSILKDSDDRFNAFILPYRLYCTRPSPYVVDVHLIRIRLSDPVDWLTEFRKEQFIVKSDRIQENPDADPKRN